MLLMNPTRLFDFIYYQRERYPQARAFSTLNAADGGQNFSTDKVIAMANAVARGLLALGLQPGDKVATVVSRTLPEWVALDTAMMQIGVINVPVYPTISGSDYVYIFNDAEVKYCFAGDAGLAEKVLNIQSEVASLVEVFSFYEGQGVRHWSALHDTKEGQDEVNRRMAAVKPDDLATIIYTSGTTGNPKGVMLSHDNIVSNIKAIMPLIPLVAGERALSFLPVCHIFERVVIYAYTFYGANVTFTGMDNLGGETGDLRRHQPHFFTAVPRLLEKVYEKIMNKGNDLTGIKRKLFFWAIELTEDYQYDKTYSGLAALKRKIADKLIFAKWREALGGHLKGIITGASPCPMMIARVFSAAGVPVREGYGLTESSPGIAVSRFDKGGAQLGSVGPVIDGGEVRIDNDGTYREGEGEVLYAGPNVMLGYYNKPEETAATIVEMDGKRWLRTGDIGMMFTGPNGSPFLKITDRKKELLKTSGGKYVAPLPIEGKLKEHTLVDQVMVVGDNRKFVSALIVPAQDALRDWCSRHNLPWTNLAEVLQHPKVVERFQWVVDKYNPAFAKFEQIKKITLLEEPWEPVKADGSVAELTPTMKLKRRVIVEKCAKQIEEMYA